MRSPLLRFFTALGILLLGSGCGGPAAATIAPAAPEATEASAPEASAVIPVGVNGLGSVAVLVIDDFTIEVTNDTNLAQMVKNAGDKVGNGNCVYSLDGQQVYDSRGAQVYDSRGAESDDSKILEGIPHGEIVYDEIYKLIDQNFTFDRDETPPLSWMKRMKFWKTPDEHEIALIAVDTDHYATDAVRDRTEQAINQIGSTYGIQRFVINMSFVVLPCNPSAGKDAHALYQEYLQLIDKTPELNSLQASLDKLADRTTGKFLVSDQEVTDTLLYDPSFGRVRLRSVYGSSAEDFKSSRFYNQITNDPLGTWTKEVSQKEQLIVSVAAAGNEGLPFAFAPGIWDSVVSVSASGDAGLAPFSNWGEVMLEGTTNYNGADVYGTSYAAPILSFAEATYLYKGGDIKCTGIGVPPLGYAAINGPWDNLQVPDASSRFCTDFATLAILPSPAPTVASPATGSTSSSPTCTNDSAFVSDVTIPDDTHFSAGTIFTKTWRVLNNGTCPWDGTYNLIFMSGEQMSGPASVPIPMTVAPGDTVEISVQLIAPMADGSYRGDWQIAAPDGTAFGAQPYVQIIVP